MATEAHPHTFSGPARGGWGDASKVISADSLVQASARCSATLKVPLDWFADSAKVHNCCCTVSYCIGIHSSARAQRHLLRILGTAVRQPLRRESGGVGVGLQTNLVLGAAESGVLQTNLVLGAAEVLRTIAAVEVGPRQSRWWRC